MKQIVDLLTLLAIGLSLGAVISTPFVLREVAKELHTLTETLKQQTTNSKP